jgi:hypothetical protein
MKKPLVVLCAVLAATGLSIVANRTTALAHDVHTYPKVTLALGWLHEPAYVGFDNAVQVVVKDPAGKPITNLTPDDLVVDISLGAQTLNGAKLVPTADPDTGLGIPGEYEAHLIPTAPGNYTFHLHGTVTGQAIDEKVAAGPTTFAEVQDGSQAQFPNKVPAVADVAARGDQVSRRAQTASDAAKAAQTSEDGTRTLAIIGTVLAGVSLLLVLVTLPVALRKRPT